MTVSTEALLIFTAFIKCGWHAHPGLNGQIHSDLKEIPALKSVLSESNVQPAAFILS